MADGAVIEPDQIAVAPADDEDGGAVGHRLADRRPHPLDQAPVPEARVGGEGLLALHPVLGVFSRQALLQTPHLGLEAGRLAHELAALVFRAARSRPLRDRGEVAPAAPAAGGRRQPHHLGEQLGDLPRVGLEQPLDLDLTAAIDRRQSRRDRQSQRIGGRILELQQPILGVDREVVAADPVAPTLAVELDAALEAAGAPARRRLEMGEDGLVAVMDLAAPLAEAQAEVDVLERVEEAGIEPTDPLERGAIHQHAGRRSPPAAAASG